MIVLFLVGVFQIAGGWSTVEHLFGTSGAKKVVAAKVTPAAQLRQVAAMNVDDKTQIIAEGEVAQLQNAAIPVSAQPLENARKFMLAGANEAAYPTALKCLTQAVYYEAANEPLEGRRAVAQVVLNRMRHPLYPKSVCGVVYQGSERNTGCQFSFTCDGALLRAPAAASWKAAEAVARAALAGYVEKSVGTATHYHADYVLPKWAFQLAKIEQLGRHIFYHFNGGWGRASALTGRYSGVEHIPALNFDALRARMLADGSAYGSEAFVPGLTVPPHITDRHTANDVGGRIDMTKEWRPTVPDPVAGGSHYRDMVAETAGTPSDAAAAPAANSSPAVVAP